MQQQQKKYFYHLLNYLNSFQIVQFFFPLCLKTYANMRRFECEDINIHPVHTKTLDRVTIGINVLLIWVFK